MSEPTAEDQRAYLAAHVAMVIERETGIKDDRATADAAYAVLAFLESGDAGVYLVAGEDIQGTVAIVLGQLREARADAEDLRTALAAHEANGQRARRHLGLIWAALNDAPEPLPNVDLSQLAPDISEHMAELRELRAEVAQLKADRDAHLKICQGVGQ